MIHSVGAPRQGHRALRGTLFSETGTPTNTPTRQATRPKTVYSAGSSSKTLEHLCLLNDAFYVLWPLLDRS